MTWHTFLKSFWSQEGLDAVFLGGGRGGEVRASGVSTF